METIPFEIVLAEWKNDIEDYMAVYTDILRELGEAAKSSNSDDTTAWYTKCLKYNVPGSSKHMYGVLAVVMYKGLIKKDQLTAENVKLAQYLGWCVELLHSAIYVSDDVLDQGATRRGQVSWYKLKEASCTTPNDVLMIENGIYELLRKHFRHLDCYVSMLELFHKMMFQSTQGQLMDYLVSKKSVSTFNMEMYNSMVMDKTGCHMLYLPAALALHLAGVKDPQIFHQCKTLLVEMGHFCQVQNDFLDCFVNADITGKIGTDIQENKCSWLAVVCMQQANPEQRAIMVECYGKSDPQKIARVKDLYEEMKIPNLYVEYENETYNKFRKLIEQTSKGIPKEVFQDLLNFSIKDKKINKA